MADVAELKGIARLKVHDGKLEEFKRLSAECIEIMRATDSGTLQYEIYVSDDQSECVFIERFSDAEALLEHNKNLGDLLEAMLATGTVSAELFGTPNDELRAKFAGSPVRFYTLLRSL